MTKPAISVIIAMYNAEKYIAECLASLANQTLQDFEIIVVDDCSTDNSLKIVESFSAIFGGRLRVSKLSKNSGCLGIPRNFVMKASCGKYIYFLDSDDLLSETALENFYDVAEKFNADVVHAEKCITFTNDNGQFEAEVFSNQTEELVTEPTLETKDLGERVKKFIHKKIRWQVWGKLFLRKFLMDNKIKFTSVNVFEDLIFSFMCVVSAKNYVHVPFVDCYYRIREDSLSHEVRDVVEVAQTMISVVNALDNFMNSKKFFHENFQCRYALIDFFIQERLAIIAENFFVTNKLDPAKVFDFFRAKIFSAKSNDNAALTAYLFVATALKSV